MASVNDWAAKLAEQIDDEYIGRRIQRPTLSRLAAIIVIHAAPLLDLLNESRRHHAGTYLAEENDHAPCPRYFDDDLTDICTCGAEEWNARIDAVLDGRNKS